MLKELRPALMLLALFTLLTGVVYPAGVTAAAQLLFPHQANGSLIRRDGVVRGSSLIAQPFTSARYFWPRPSATSPAWNAAASGASNLGPMNPLLDSAIAGRAVELRAAGGAASAIPVDLVTTSGSGLDPHISPAAAHYQVARVAAARRMSASDVARLVDAHTEPRTLGLLGEARVNVLLLNLALDSASTAP